MIAPAAAIAIAAIPAPPPIILPRTASTPPKAPIASAAWAVHSNGGDL